MKHLFVFYSISITIFLSNVKTLGAVQILSPWITELMKQRYEDIGPEGK